MNKNSHLDFYKASIVVFTLSLMSGCLSQPSKKRTLDSSPTDSINNPSPIQQTTPTLSFSQKETENYVESPESDKSSPINNQNYSKSDFVSKAHYELFNSLVYSPKNNLIEKYDHQKFANVKYAWDRGLTGKGINIGIADSGINYNHEQFSMDSINFDKSFTMTAGYVARNQAFNWTDLDTETFSYDHPSDDPRLNIASDSSHGTHVAGILVGKDTGIAPDATISVAKVFVHYDDPDYPDSPGYNFATPIITTQAVKRLVNTGSKVINLSMTGLLYAFDPEAFQNMKDAFSNNDVVAVIAAGNQALNMNEILVKAENNPETSGMIYSHNTLTKEHMVYVGSSRNHYWGDKARYILADYSNYPGDDIELQKHFIVADGSYVASANSENNTGISIKTGTSMAAPVVTGSIALLMSASPNITAIQASEILLKTADKDFDEYDPYYFGTGILDLKKALSPIGEIKTSTSYLPSHPLASTNLVAPKEIQSKISSLSSIKNVAVYDDYNRSFLVDISKLTHNYKNENFSYIQNKDILSIQNSNFAPKVVFNKKGIKNISTFIYPSLNKNKPKIKVEAYFDGNTVLSLTNTQELRENKLGFIFPRNPLRQFSSLRLTHKNVFYSVSTNIESISNKAKTIEFLTGYKKDFLNFSGGIVKMKNHMLEMYGEGAFGIGDSILGKFKSEIKYDFTKKISFFGITTLMKILNYEPVDGSYIQEIKNTTSLDLKIGGVFHKNNIEGGLSVFSDNQLLSGRIKLALPVGITKTNQQITQIDYINLSSFIKPGFQGYFKQKLKNSSIILRMTLAPETNNYHVGFTLKKEW